MGAAAIIGGVAAIGGAVIASDAMGSAADKQTASQQRAINEQQRQFDLQQQNQAPWLAAGKSALQAQMDLLGIGGTAATPGTPAMYAGGYGGMDRGMGGYGGYAMPAMPAMPGVSANDAQLQAIQHLQQSPLYQSLYRNGQETLLNNAAATGGLRGGNMKHSLANFGADTLAQVIQQQITNLGGISGTGQNSAQNLGQLGQNNANAQSNLMNAQGQSQAGGILGSAGIWNNAFNSIGKSFGNAVQNAPLGMFGLVTPTAGVVSSAANTIASNPGIF